MMMTKEQFKQLAADSLWSARFSVDSMKKYMALESTHVARANVAAHDPEFAKILNDYDIAYVNQLEKVITYLETKMEKDPK